MAKLLYILNTYIHYTSDWALTHLVGNICGECKLAVCVDSKVARDLKDSTPTNECCLALVGSNTFVPIIWFCKHHSAVSHSSSEEEAIALDVGRRVEGVRSVVFWEQVLEVLCPIWKKHQHTSGQNIIVTG